MSGSGRSQPQITVNQYLFPKEVVSSGNRYFSDTTQDLTKLLESGARYWNNARRIANQRMGRVENHDLIRIAQSPSDNVGDIFTFGICKLESNDIYFTLGTKFNERLCIDPLNQGDATITVIHEMGHAILDDDRNPLLINWHPPEGVVSAMTPNNFLLFGVESCNLDIENPLEYDILLAGNVTIKSYALSSGPYRMVLKDQPYQAPDYPVCELVESSVDTTTVRQQVTQALKRQATGVAMGFLTGIVTELLEIPQVKALPYYNVISKGVKILPHLLYVLLTIGVSGVSVGSVFGLLATFGICSLQCSLSYWMNPENRNTFKGKCCNILTHPMLPMILMPLFIFSGNATRLYGLPETHAIYGVITEGVMALLGPMAGYGIAKGVAKAGKAVVKGIESLRHAQPPISITPPNPHDAVINMESSGIEMVNFSSYDPDGRMSEDGDTSWCSTASTSSTDVVIEMDDA